MDERIIITAKESGERLDALLAHSMDALTRSAAVRLIEQGLVTLNGAGIKKNYKCAEGDTFVVCLPPPEDVPLVPQDILLDVV